MFPHRAAGRDRGSGAGRGLGGLLGPARHPSGARSHGGRRSSPVPRVGVTRTEGRRPRFRLEWGVDTFRLEWGWTPRHTDRLISPGLPVDGPPALLGWTWDHGGPVPWTTRTAGSAEGPCRPPGLPSTQVRGSGSGCSGRARTWRARHGGGRRGLWCPCRGHRQSRAHPCRRSRALDLRVTRAAQYRATRPERVLTERPVHKRPTES